MYANGEVIAQKISEITGYTHSEGRRQLNAFIDAMNALIEEGYTCFKIPRMFTMETYMIDGSQYTDLHTKEIKVSPPKLRVTLKLYDHIKKGLKEAHNVSSKVL